MDTLRKVSDFMKTEEVLGVPTTSMMYKASVKLQQYYDEEKKIVDLRSDASKEINYQILKIKKAYSSIQLKKMHELIDYRRSQI